MLLRTRRGTVASGSVAVSLIVAVLHGTRADPVLALCYQCHVARRTFRATCIIYVQPVPKLPVARRGGTGGSASEGPQRARHY